MWALQVCVRVFVWEGETCKINWRMRSQWNIMVKKTKSYNAGDESAFNSSYLGGDELSDLDFEEKINEDG